MIIYLEKPRETTTKLIHTIKQLSKVAGYISTRTTVFISMDNNQLEDIMEDQIPYMTAK